MNKTSKVKCLLLPVVIASAGVFVGCTNNDYDFNEVDMTLGLGGNELLIPTSTTKEIALDDILKINEGDCVKILENGDYVFTQEGSDVEPAHPFVERVTLVQASEPVTFDFSLDTYLNPAAARNRARASVPVDAKAEIVKFEYEAEQPEILSITSANVDATMTLTTSFSPNLSKCIGTFDKLTWELPQSMKIENATVSSGVLDSSFKGTNMLIVEGVSTAKDVVITINIKTLDFSDSNNKELVINNGKMELNGAIQLGIQSSVEITPDMVQYLNNCYLSSKLAFTEIPIIGAVGKFDPKINLDDLGNVDVTGVPDFLKEDAVVVDLANPQILVEIDNEMDAAAKISSATLTAIKDGKETTVNIPTIAIHPAQVTKICICRDASKVQTAYADYDKYPVNNLSDIISTIPDRITFAVSDIKVDNSRNSSFDLGREYSIKPSYNIVAPIAFGEKANIVYTDSIDGIYDDIDGVELAKDAYVEVTANVENKLPIFLSTSVTPLDVNGNDLSQSVKVTVVDNIPAAEEGKTAHGSIKITVKGDIKQLDKLKFRIEGSASKGETSITGITLNKDKHSLKLDNVKAKLVGKVIYDAN